MASIKIYKRLQDLKDVDPNGLPHLGVPQYRTNVSKFVVQTVAGGGGGTFNLGVSTIGNTFGDTGVTGSQIVLAASNGITLVQSTDGDGATIGIYGDTSDVAFSAGISGGNTAGQTGLTGSQVVFAGGSNITLSGATDGNGGTISIVGPNAGAFSLGISGGNTSGSTGATGSRVVLAGGNNITLSQSTNANGATITISGPATHAVQTGISSIVASDATYTSGSVQFTGSGIVTVKSSANQRVVIDASQSAQTQNLHNVTLSGNTAGAMAQVSSGTLTLAGGNNVTLSQAGNAVTISGPNTVAQTEQTQNRFNLTLSGNTSGALAQVSSGTLTLAGGNNITLSQAGNAITISGANAGGAQTAISGLANSQTTYTSGTVSLSELGAITIRSTTGNQFQFSVNPQSVQPETQTFVAGISASDTLYTSGNVRFTGVGGGITVSSNTGQRVDLSVAAQSVQPGVQHLVVSNTTFSSGTVSISGFGDVTVNTAANIIRISAPTQTAESQSIGMSNLGNTSGTTGIASGAQVRFLLAGGNNITLSQSLNGASGTLTISAASQTLQTSNVHNVTLSGNTAGAMAQVSSGTMTLAGGNNITLSQNGNAITISGANIGGAQTGISGIANSETTYTSGSVTFSELGAITIRSTTGQRFQFSVDPQSVQTVGMYAVGNTTGQSSSTTRDARSISVDGAGAVSVGYSGGTLRISAPVQTAQTGISGIANSQTTYTSGTVSLSELGAITIRSTTGNQFQLSVAAQTAESQSLGMSNLGNTSGTTGIASGAQVRFLLAGGNNITLSQSLNGASGTITISAPNAVAQTDQTLGLYAVGNTTGQSSSTTRDARSISVDGAGIVSVGYSGGTLRISAVESNQTLGMYAVGNTTGQSSSTTRDARSISVDGAGAVSVGYSGGTLRVSAPVQTVQTQNLHNVTLSGNTAGAMAQISSGTMTLAGGANITLSQNGNAVTISGASGAYSAGMSNIGNTSGDTGITGSRLVLAGGNNITLSQSTNASGGTVTISAFNQSVDSLGLYAVGNTTGQSSSTTRDARSISVDGAGIVSVGFSGGTLRISATEVAQTNQTLGLYAVGNTTGQSSSTTRDARSVSFDGAGAASVGFSGGTVRISAPDLTVISAVAPLSTSTNGSTLSILGPAQFSGGFSTAGNTSGNTGFVTGRLALVGGNNVTLSGSTDAGSLTITISAGAGGTGGFSGGVSNVGNTSGNTGITGSRLVLAGGNNITLSQSTNASGGTVTVSAPATSSLVGVSPITVSTDGSTISILGPAQLSAGFSTAGNTSGNTGFVTGRLALVGSNGVTLSGSTNAGSQTITISGATQTVQTQNRFNLTLSGNTAGAMAQISSGTMTLAGGANVTLSQAGNAVTISAGGGSSSDTDVTSISQTAHGFSVGDWLRLDGTDYVLAQADTEENAEVVGVVSAVADANTFTLLTGGLLTGLSGLTAGDVYYLSDSVAGEITNTAPTDVGAVLKPVFIARTTTSGYVFNMRGNVIPDPTSGLFNAGVSTGGNTAGATGVTGTRLVFVGSNNITLSQTTGVAGGTISFFGGAGGAGFSAGVSNLGASSGDTGVTGTRLVFAGSNGITLSQSTNTAGGTITVSGITQTVQTQNLHNVTLSGNTAGAMAHISSGTLTLAGGNNITLSQAGNAVTISGGAGGAFSAGMSTEGNTAGATGVSGSRMVLVGTGPISLSQTTGAAGNTVSIRGPATSSLVAGANITVSTDGSTISIIGGAGAGYSAGVSNVGNTAGDTGITGSRLVLAGTNGITLSQSTNASGGTVTISGITQSAESHSLGMSNLGNTSGTTGIASGPQVRFLFAGGNNITLSQSLNGASGTLTISAPNQSVQPGIQHLIASDATFSSGTVSISGFGDVTVNTAANIIRISAPVQTVESQSIGASNLGNTLGTSGVASGGQVRAVIIGTSNITVSQSVNGASATLSLLGQPGFSGGVSNLGNTGGDTGMTATRLVFVGSNNVTLSQTTGAAGATIGINAAAGGAGGSFSAGASNLGNTAGATGITGTQLVLVGGNALSLSQTTGANGGTVTFNAAGFSAGVSTGGNTAGDTGMTATRLVLVGPSPMSLSQATGANGATVSINAPATSSVVGASGISISTNGSTISIMQTTGSNIMTSYAPYDESPMVTGQQGQGSLHLSPLRIPDALAFDRVALGMQISNATNSSGSITISNWVGLYTRNASTLSLYASTSISTNFTGSGTAGSYSLYGGPRWHTIGWTTTLTDGHYYIAFINRTTSGGANASVSQMLVSKFTNENWSGLIGAGTATSAQRNLGQGHYSATTSAFPASIGFSQIVGTGSIVLRNPVYMFRSGTV